MKSRFPHLPSVPAPGKFALHSSAQVSTRTSIAPHQTARLSLGAARPPHLQLALRTTRAPRAGCHAPALSAPTTRLAVAPRVLAPLAPPMPGSTPHAPAGCSPSPHQQRPGSPAHTRGWSPASAGVVPHPLAPPGAASSCPLVRLPRPARLLTYHRVP